MSTAAATHQHINYESRDFAEQLAPGKVVLMHLLPGALVMLVFAGLSRALAGTGLSNMMVFILAALISLTGGQLGFLYVQGWRRNGRLSLEGIVLYREPIEFKTYLWLVPVILIATMALFILFSFADGLLLTGLFSWWPAAWDLNLDPANQAQAVTLGTIIAMYLVVNLAGPFVEELYFRGYLLPRLARYGRLAPVINGVLFAAYHFWSPWAVISRAVGILPLTFAVQHRKNITIGIIVHCALNCIGSLPLLLAVL